MVGENQQNVTFDFQQKFVETTPIVFNVCVAKCLFLDKLELNT